MAKKLYQKFKIPLSPTQKVNFVIGGTQKGGTTALDAYFREHPEICMAEVKETHYFDTEQNFTSETPDYSKYHNYFSPKKTHKVLGET
ncbi:MAG: hypothetical protein RLN82_01130, partial [Pseudomonadales bacterium]